MRRLAVLALPPLLLACAGNDAAQQVYALEVEYEVAAAGAVAYIGSPGADKQAVAAIVAADGTAHAALVAARATVEGGGTGPTAGTAAALAGAQSALASFTALVAAKEPTP